MKHNDDFITFTEKLLKEAFPTFHAKLTPAEILELATALKEAGTEAFLETIKEMKEETKC